MSVVGHSRPARIGSKSGNVRCAAESGSKLRVLAVLAASQLVQSKLRDGARPDQQLQSFTTQFVSQIADRFAIEGITAQHIYGFRLNPTV
jgi:hypothetical protein